MQVITSVVPKSTRKGDEAIFYIRDLDLQRSFSLEERVRHIVVTGAIERSQVIELLKPLRQEHPSTEFSLKPYSREKRIIWARCTREEKERLPRSFIRTKLKRFYVGTSRQFEPEEAARMISEMSSDERIAGIDFGFEDSRIVALCEKSGVRKLPDFFDKENYREDKREVDYLRQDSPTRMLRWRFPPFIEAPLMISGGALRFDFKKYWKLVKTGAAREASLEALLSQRRAALDIEVEKFDTPDETIHMAVFYTNGEFGNRIFTIYDPRIRETDGTRIVLCRDQSDLIRKLEACEREFDPLFVMGHNIMAYDRLKLRGASEDDEIDYAPGPEGDSPRIEASDRIRNLRRVVTRGRFEIDTFPYVLHNRNILRSRSLETHVRRLGTDFRKSHSYGEMEAMIDRWKQGDQEAGVELVKYSNEDGRVSFELGSAMLRNVLLKALCVRRSPSAVCASTNTNLIEDSRRRQYFSRMHTFRFEWKYLPIREPEEQYEIEGTQVEEKKPVRHTRELLDLEELMFDTFNLGAVSGVKTRTGVFENSSVVYFTPFIEALKPILLADKGAARVFKELRESKDFDTKYDLAQFLNAFLREPIENIIELLKKIDGRIGEAASPSSFEGLEIDDWRFGKAYGLAVRHEGKSANLLFLSNRLAEVVDGIRKKIDGSSIVNYSKRFVFFDRLNDAEEVERRNLGVVLGQGNVLSVSPGRAAAMTQLQIEPMYQGIGISRMDDGYKHFFGRFIEEALATHNEEDLFGMARELATFMDEKQRADFIERHGDIVYAPFSDEYRRKLDFLFHQQPALFS